VAYLTAELFELHDRSQFEVIAFNFGEPTNDLMQDRLRQSFDQFHDVAHLDDEQIVQLARSLPIDLAVDLAGYTADNRSGIFARRVAPVQINYLGFPGTLGHPQIDYIIGDPLVTPDSLHGSYSEKVISLPCFQVNDRQRPISDRVFTRAELGIPSEHFVFCCFNSSYKITPAMFNTWLRILHACPASSLLLVKYHDQTEINLKQYASDQGLDPKRLIFCPKVPTPDYLARFRVADLFLDSSPFNAGTTASDALWAGLPVLTLAGQTFAGRMAASLLHAVGLPELVADDVHGYEQLAIRLATTPGELVQIRDRLATQRLRTLLFDTPVFVSRYEAALLLAHQRQHQGLPPQAIDMSHTMTKP
jgi:predicted O-linked N-acetylglucosamine transferase (SPINDLY family)